MQPSKSKYIIVKRSNIHKTGVFARIDIPKGTRVIEYVGEIITKAEAERRADITLGKAQKDGTGAVYIFELNKRHDIDGSVSWNTAKYINHSCEPNCETENIRGHIWIIALRNISKGEELSYNYGYNVDNFDDHPCRCGSTNCLGYIVGEDYRQKLKELLSKRKRLMTN